MEPSPAPTPDPDEVEHLEGLVRYAEAIGDARAASRHRLALSRLTTPPAEANAATVVTAAR